MSLQVWLPLNGDLKQNGVSSTIIDTNGVEINANGKIGKCIEFNGSITSHIYSNNFNTNLWTECSITLWLKIVSFNAAWDTYLQIGDSNTPWNSYIVGLLRNNTNSNLVFCISNGTTSTQASFTTPNLETGTWYHIACIYKPGHCLIYINGNLHADNTTTIVPNFSSSTKLCIGGLPSAYKSKSCMNDLRIYDHALSIKEIKEISKALVCHYPLDNNGIGNSNLAKGTNTASTGTNVFGYGEQTGGSSRTIEYDGGIPCAKITRNTTAHSGWAYLYYNNLDVPAIKTSTTYTVSFDVIASGVGNIGWNGFMMGNATNSLSQSLTTIQNTFNADTWSHIVFQVTTKSSFDGITVGSQLVYMNTAYLQGTGTWLKMKNMKVEEGTRDTSWCPHTSDAIYSIFNINGTTEFDTSGFKNNGTRNAVTIVSDSPRYSCATKFDGSTSFIACGRGGMVKDEITLNLWAYSANWNTTVNECMFSCTEGGGWSISKNTSGNLSIYMGTGISSNTYVTLGYALSNMSAGWNMITVTYNGLDLKLFVNGTLRTSKTPYTTKTPIYYHSSNGIFIGAEASGSTTSPASAEKFPGNISDVRIYATALSDADILEFYNTGASIDNSGNVLTYDIQEK